MNFLDKLDYLMEKNGYTKSTLSQLSGIPYTTIDAWYKKGFEGLKLTTLKKLCAFFDTSLDFFIKDEITDVNYGKASGFEFKYEEMEHIKKYRALDKFGKAIVENITDMELKRVNAQSVKNNEESKEKTYTVAARGNSHAVIDDTTAKALADAIKSTKDNIDDEGLI